MLMLPFVNGKRKENVKKYGRCRGERELQTKKKEKENTVLSPSFLCNTGLSIH
jgi:hypothetical protein